MTRKRLAFRAFLFTLATGLGVARIAAYFAEIPVNIPVTTSGTVIVVPASNRNFPAFAGDWGSGGGTGGGEQGCGGSHCDNDPFSGFQVGRTRGF